MPIPGATRSDDHPAAGDVQRHAGDPGRRVRGQVQHGVADVRGLADAAQRERRAELVQLLAGHRGLHALVEHRRRGQAVDPDAVLGHLAGQVLAEHHHAGLRRGVGRAGPAGRAGRRPRPS